MYKVFDARGNGDGQTAPTLTGDHQNRITDYTAIVMKVLYPKVTGALCANSHPGSYTGQDAYNDMLPVIGEEPCTTSMSNECENTERGGVQAH